MNTATTIDVGLHEAAHLAAELEAAWTTKGDNRDSRVLSKRATKLNPAGAFLSESQWVGLFISLLRENGIPTSVEQIADSRDWLWTLRCQGFQPGEIAEFLAGGFHR